MDGALVYVNRITHNDNTSNLTIEENGVISTYSFVVDYQSLYLNLMNEADDVPVTYDRVAGYTYTYFNYDSYTDYRHASQGISYSAILGWASSALAKYNIPLAAATWVASKAVEYGMEADTEMKGEGNGESVKESQVQNGWVCISVYISGRITDRQT